MSKHHLSQSHGEICYSVSVCPGFAASGHGVVESSGGVAVVGCGVVVADRGFALAGCRGGVSDTIGSHQEIFHLQ